MRVGFVGLGMMGAPMVRCLAGAGHEVLAFDVRADAMAALANVDNIHLAPELSGAAEGANAVITMLPDGPTVRKVVLGGLAEAMEPEAVLIDMSTSYPLQTTSLREALPTQVGFIDAPVSGGVARAETGALTIMAGGEGNTIERVMPALSAMGTVHRTGPLGSGHAMKVLNNYLSAAGLAAACEALLVGQNFGLDPDVMADVFNVSTGRNNATDVKLKQHINNNRYASGFTMGLMAKDLALACRLAEEMQVDARGLGAMALLYREGADSLGDGADHTAVMKQIEAQAAVKK